VRAALLALLAEKPMHGYEMIRELGERTNGAWAPSPGSVYPTLTMLEEEGLVTAEEVDGKRRFSLTEAGRTAAAEREGAPPWEDFGMDPGVAALGEILGTTAQAVKQVLRAGTPAQQAKAVEVLTETRRKLYEILASDE
jgi:DNA-binding PadR family transcriptional regulator